MTREERDLLKVGSVVRINFHNVTKSTVVVDMGPFRDQLVLKMERGWFRDFGMAFSEGSQTHPWSIVWLTPLPL